MTAIQTHGMTRVFPSGQADHVLNRLLVEHGHAIHGLARHQPSLEALFFELTGAGENAA